MKEYKQDYKLFLKAQSMSFSLNHEIQWSLIFAETSCKVYNEKVANFLVNDKWGCGLGRILKHFFCQNFAQQFWIHNSTKAMWTKRMKYDHLFLMHNWMKLFLKYISCLLIYKLVFSPSYILKTTYFWKLLHETFSWNKII